MTVRVLMRIQEMMLKGLVWLVMLTFSLGANAICYRDGRPYPTGAVVDGYVCQADGTWKRQ